MEIQAGHNLNLFVKLCGNSRVKNCTHIVRTIIVHEQFEIPNTGFHRIPGKPDRPLIAVDFPSYRPLIDYIFSKDQKMLRV